MINIRKGIFETSSSSEDSLSVYQSMKLFIIPTWQYEMFTNGDMYICFNSLHPTVTDNWLYSRELNDKIIKKGYTGSQIPAAYIAGHFEELYLSYEEYLSYLNREYSDYNLFKYEDGDNTIFGFYGYDYD